MSEKRKAVTVVEERGSSFQGEVSKSMSKWCEKVKKNVVIERRLGHLVTSVVEKLGQKLYFNGLKSDSN